MHPLNPFLRAFFRSTVPGQAIPTQNHILLVPSTESLLNCRDRDSGKKYTELVQDEEFIGCHVVRILPEASVKDTNVRDNRGKAKSLTTVNGHTVIIKENMVYSNKGFKTIIQAQLLTDVLYYSPTDAQQWLIYYISKPLIGSPELVSITVPLLGPKPASKLEQTDSSATKKKEIKSFREVLNNFPMIARQMQPGLERLFNEFGKELGRPLPPPPSSSGSEEALSMVSTEVNGSIHKVESNGSVKLPFISTDYKDSEDLLRAALETAVTAAIDLFQLVDKQQLSFLGATTDLTGPVVEKLIEKYVAEQVHDNLLFPRLCQFHRIVDQELDYRIRQLQHIDVSQLGIAIERGKKSKEELIQRVYRGVEQFRKLGVAGSPQEMLQILLDTERAVTEQRDTEPGNHDEKTLGAMTINADVLVSLLLVVVIRSQIRHLQARLSYMQRFIYIEDVESGEIGYTLSTFEAVLTYLQRDSSSLRRASARNRKLWEATRNGQVEHIKEILEGDEVSLIDEEVVQEPEEDLEISASNGSIVPIIPETRQVGFEDPESAGLSHVFPFQSQSTPSILQGMRKGKRVHLDLRSMSTSSAISFKSRASTMMDSTSGIEGDTSIESLAQTQDSAGNSVLMMAVDSKQPESLRYLLSIADYYPIETVLADGSPEGATLLSAAIQLGDTELIDIILEFVEKFVEQQQVVDYLLRVDKHGRTACHYLVNAPYLIQRLEIQVPWHMRDRNGQTPLFALCRSYDHPEYAKMVSDALELARIKQNDGLSLRLDLHTDNRGNTLLHIINDPTLSLRVLHTCDADPNAVNDKKFTPLMLASKYGRLDMVRVFFSDPRVDLTLKEIRGLTAVELAKDDEVRNRIDDMTLFSGPTKVEGRVTHVVRSYFVEDGTTRFILKSGAPSSTSTGNTYTITTSRRSLQDFENLSKWLKEQHPASYIPNLSSSPTNPAFRTPFQIHSKPSRAVLHDTQLSLDRFLKTMLEHPTFGNHEMLWEFFLVPDLQVEAMSQRARLKAQLLQEEVQEEYEPVAISEVREVESIVAHSRDMVRSINIANRHVIRRGHALYHAQSDLSDVIGLQIMSMASLGPPSTTLPNSHVNALSRYASLMVNPPDSSPLRAFIANLTSFASTITAVQTSLIRPSNIITRMTQLYRSLQASNKSLQTQSLPRTFTLEFLEQGRAKTFKDTEHKIALEEGVLESLGRELRWTQEVVLGELAGWTNWREQYVRNAVKDFAKETIVKEKERGEGLKRCLRRLRECKEWSGGTVGKEAKTLMNDDLKRAGFKKQSPKLNGESVAEQHHDLGEPGPAIDD